MKVKIKKLHENSVIPKYAKNGDAGLDLVAVTKEFDNQNNACYDTKIAVEIPENHVGLIFPRSSISKTDMSLRNAVGVVDSNYRGSIVLKFKSGYHNDYEVGDRVGQLIIMPYPKIEFEEVEELSETERGEGGFGSTGK